MATDKDYYLTLGVPGAAGATDIKEAYHKLALRYHPDRNPLDAMAEVKLREINEAYEILGNVSKRTEYDSVNTALVIADPLQQPNFAVRLLHAIQDSWLLYALKNTYHDYAYEVTHSRLNIAASLLLLYLFEHGLSHEFQRVFGIGIFGGLLAPFRFLVFLWWLLFQSEWHWLSLSALACMSLLPMMLKPVRMWHMLLGAQMALAALIAFYPPLMQLFAPCYGVLFNMVKPCLCPM